MTPTEYHPHPNPCPRSVAEYANRLDLQVIVLCTGRHRIPTYLFWEHGTPRGWTQGHARTWLQGYEAGWMAA